MKNLVLGAAIGQCVHIAGLSHFLRLCEEEGFLAINLGPAIPVKLLFDKIVEHNPCICAISFRLTPEDFKPLLKEIRERKKHVTKDIKFFFGGTPPVAKLALNSGLFVQVFAGSETLEEIKSAILGKKKKKQKIDFPQTLIDRIEYSSPFPIIRHHYGEPNLEATIKGARKISLSRTLDVLSLGPDQNAQEFFFSPEKMDKNQDGAGGVPLRKREDLLRIYNSTRCGNYPLLRCYSGTNDLIKWAQMLKETINIAWGAVPLCWYSSLDGRSKKGIAEAIEEKQAAISYYAKSRIPVEVNESHQWSLRDAHDSLAVAMAFLSAYNAKKLNVRTFVLQMMFNNPPSTSPHMDLAKMLAKLEMVKSLEDRNFRILREVRAGIASIPSDPYRAKGHLSASAVYSMMLKPHILHIVGFSEGYKIVTPSILIESCKIGRGAINLAIKGNFDLEKDSFIRSRKNHLIKEATIIIEAIKSLGKRFSDPLTAPSNIENAIRVGILDTPHFAGLKGLKGEIVTACVNGGWEAICPKTRNVLSERERIRNLGVDF
ncbi:MAG: cobalamin B12-binding domain-containing protein [Acidobacteriota bacterium]|nr:cobalamin B12-binding domain-containing protein [Thermoanaerobaculaceae bacterium]